MIYKYIQSFLFVSILANNNIYAGDQPISKSPLSSWTFRSLFKTATTRTYFRMPTRDMAYIGTGLAATLCGVLGLRYIYKTNESPITNEPPMLLEAWLALTLAKKAELPPKQFDIMHQLETQASREQAYKTFKEIDTEESNNQRLYIATHGEPNYFGMTQKEMNSAIKNIDTYLSDNQMLLKNELIELAEQYPQSYVPNYVDPATAKENNCVIHRDMFIRRRQDLHDQLEREGRLAELSADDKQILIEFIPDNIDYELLKIKKVNLSQHNTFKALLFPSQEEAVIKAKNAWKPITEISDDLLLAITDRFLNELKTEYGALYKKMIAEDGNLKITLS